jgi:hypothetical protein
MPVRLRDSEFAEEDGRHGVVVVLARMDEEFLVGLSEFKTQRGSLDELRPGADDGHESHVVVSSNRPK